MIPRTVKMAAEVAAQLTSTQLEDYGNIFLNGYLSVIPNSINKKAWQYAETLTAPVDLPSLSEVRPVLKGWTTNYQEYYTQLQPNGYGVNPGDPVPFSYSTHSFQLPTPLINNGIATLGTITSSAGYTAGTYTGVTLTGGSGTGAVATITVPPLTGGAITAAVPTPSGQGGFTPGTYTSAPVTGGSGSGAIVNAVVSGGVLGAVTAITFGGSSGGGAGTFTNVSTLANTGNMTLSVDFTTTFGGGVTSMTVNNPGSGYSVGNTFFPLSGYGSIGGTVTGINVPGGVGSFSFSSGGANYLVGNSVSVNLGGSPFLLQVSAATPITGTRVATVTITNPGQGYTVGDVLTATIPGSGTGWSVPVATVVSTPATLGGGANYSQIPRRTYQNQVSAVTPPQNVNNPEAIPYTFMHPVVDNPVPPPIGTL
jgi:hypothetical protein